MCAAHLEPEMTDATAAAAASCRYIVHHCVCQDGSHQQIHFTENSYAPVRINTAAAPPPSSQAETAFAALFAPGSLGGRRKGDNRPGGGGGGGGRGKSEGSADCEAPAKSASVTDSSPSHQTSVDAARSNVLALLQASVSDYDSCSCGQAMVVVAADGGGGGVSLFADDDDAAKYAFWKKQGSYCPVYGGGQCPPPLPIAENFPQ